MKRKITLPEEFRTLVEQKASIYHKGVVDWSPLSTKAVINHIHPENIEWIKLNYSNSVLGTIM